MKAVTTTVWAEMDVKTCVDETCDMKVEDRFIADEPASHMQVTLPNGLDYWAEPGFYGSEDGTDSIRRPVLEDKDWCNNVMYNALTGNIDVCDDRTTAAVPSRPTKNCLTLCAPSVLPVSHRSLRASSPSPSRAWLSVSSPWRSPRRRRRGGGGILPTLRRRRGCCGPVSRPS